MANIHIRGKLVDVDIENELREFEWRNCACRGGKLIASSPFREDNSPSFFISLEGEFSGTWADSGAYGEYEGSGNFIKLISLLRNETYEEAEDYLLEQYSVDYATDDFKLVTATIDLGGESPEPTIAYTLDNIELDAEYLPSRGIHPKVIELMNVFDKGNSIGIPWHRTDGQLAAIKFRHKQEKTFWYASGSVPIGELVYGLDTVVERGITRAVICEAEVDAMTWMSAGIFAIAVGGARLNDKQADMIVSSGLTNILLGGDNDVAGRRFNEIVADKLRNKVDVYDINYGAYSEYKDANDIGVEGLRTVTVRKRGSVPLIHT